MIERSPGAGHIRDDAAPALPITAVELVLIDHASADHS
jgi:hypothetical protein